MTTQPSHLTILLVPEHLADDSAPVTEESAVRAAVVEATGETGASGYPRYAGNGMVADIDPSTRTVEALLVDGRELDYGLSARVADGPDR
ncbi:hypothetical protein ACQPZG_01160 (plasmid) [Streptomyces sp. CA-294286]|uniref:hypothetical protein n=1 Tax=Streptomyces sp. CA-294286 TaxID=3240070 RepID=UPI003D8B3EFE